MKKSIIAAGAASVALAAMPIVSTFAVTSGGPFIDKIQTTIGETCTFARGTKADPDATHTGTTWSTDSTGDPSGKTDVLTPQTITINETETTLGTSSFRVVCNDPAGWQVTVGTNPLTLTSGTNTHLWNYNPGGTAPSTVNASYWYLTSSDTAGANLDSNKNIVASKAVADDGSDFTVTYHAFAYTGQDSGTYSANVTYTFADLGANS